MTDLGRGQSEPPAPGSGPTGPTIGIRKLSVAGFIGIVVVYLAIVQGLGVLTRTVSGSGLSAARTPSGDRARLRCGVPRGDEHLGARGRIRWVKASWSSSRSRSIQGALGPLDHAPGVEGGLELLGQGASEFGLGRGREQGPHQCGIGLQGADLTRVPAPQVSRIHIQGPDRAAAQLDGNAQPRADLDLDKVRAISPQRRSRVASCITAGTGQATIRPVAGADSHAPPDTGAPGLASWLPGTPGVAAPAANLSRAIRGRGRIRTLQQERLSRPRRSSGSFRCRVRYRARCRCRRRRRGWWSEAGRRPCWAEGRVWRSRPRGSPRRRWW